MADLYIITGPSSVGKSTISNEIAIKKEKSVLIEGDAIYNQVVGGCVPPWENGNHLNLFWDICIDMISKYLWEGYTVVFNYIVTPTQLDRIRSRFSSFKIKFVVLLANEETLILRDKNRPKNAQMGERCIALLNGFNGSDYKMVNILDTSKFSISEIVNEIESNNRFLLK